jgi:hypothetical protein
MRDVELVSKPMVGPVTLMALGTAASGPGDHFLRLIKSGNLNKYKFNQKTRSIHVFTFRETQNPNRSDNFDFDKLTLKIIISARKHQTFQFQKVDNSIVQFCLKFQINRLRNKKVMPY